MKSCPFRKLLFKTNNEKFSVGSVKSKKICRHPGEICLTAVWRWVILERGRNEKKVEYHLHKGDG